MSSDFEVIEKLGYGFTADEFDDLQRNHPYITEKLILDAINGINVVARDLNDTSKGQEKGLRRIWDSVSGTSKQRQNCINVNHIEVMEAVTIWFRDIDKHLSRIDERIAYVADELFRTQDEILKFYKQHDDLKTRFEEFKNFTRSRLETIEHTLTQMKAQLHVDREVAKLNMLGLPVIVEIFTILDNLVSGDAGSYYFRENDAKKKHELLEYLKNKVKEKVSDQELKKFIDFVALNQAIKKMDHHEQKAIGFIGSQYSMFADGSPLYEVSDLMTIVSTSSADDVEKRIDGQSNIRTFMTLETYIDEAANELFSI